MAPDELAAPVAVFAACAEDVECEQGSVAKGGRREGSWGRGDEEVLQQLRRGARLRLIEEEDGRHIVPDPVEGESVRGRGQAGEREKREEDEDGEERREAELSGLERTACHAGAAVLFRELTLSCWR